MKNKNNLNEIIKTIKELIKFAYYDELTGCLNRRGFYWKVDENNIFSRKKEKRKIIYFLVLIDVDNFKNINENHGYDKGDNVLKIIGKLLKARFRKEDIVARWGGDEFLIILKNIKKKMLLQRLKEFKTEINKKIGKYGASLSISFTQFYPNQDFKKIFKNLEIGIKKSKRTTKNKIIFCK